MKAIPRRRILFAALACGLLLPPAAGRAADFSDPTWPCIQRKVENLSPGLMWPAEAAAPDLPPETRRAVDDLVARLVLRRIPPEDLAPKIAAFAAAHGTGAPLMGAVFSKAFRSLSATRGTLIRGIEGYAAKQTALADRIDRTRARMDRLMAAENPDFDQVDALEEQLDWDERIYTDRARSLTYVCESPLLIEKRLYAIAQLLQAQIAE